MGRQRQMVRAALHPRAGRGEPTVTDQKARGGRPETVPLPAGFGVVFDAETQFVGSDVLFGGSPPRLMPLNAAGGRAPGELRAGRGGAAGRRPPAPAASPCRLGPPPAPPRPRPRPG